MSTPATALEIVPLADRPDLVSIVARWHYDEWGHGFPGGSIDLWTDTLRGQLGRDTVPASWVGLRAGEPVGSVKLLVRDMATHPELTPWLSSVYVVPEARGRGIGRELVRHTEAAARELGYQRIHLYTTTAERLYATEGWTVVVREPYGEDFVTIMAKDLRPAGPPSEAAERRNAIDAILTAADELNRAETRVHERFEKRERSAAEFDLWRASTESMRSVFARLYESLDMDAIERGDPDAIDQAVTFLEADPYAFRSGYVKEWLLTRLKRARLSEDQRRRLRAVVLAAIDRGDRREFRRYARLAARIADDEFRAKVEARTRSLDSGIARRARWVSAYVVEDA